MKKDVYSAMERVLVEAAKLLWSKKDMGAALALDLPLLELEA